MAEVHGRVEPGFEKVREAFANNFDQHGDLGASFCLYQDGRPVVDLWGGVADATTGRPWTEDTTSLVFSTTKGATAVCANLLVERGDLDLDTPVAEYWPEFAAAGKGDIPVRWLLSHRTGLPGVPSGLTLADVLAWDPVVEALAAAEPVWPPGTAHGYHALTYGWLVGEVVRRVTGESIGTFFRKEVGEPLGLDFWIGLPDSEQDKVSRLEWGTPPDTSQLPEELRLVMEQHFGPGGLGHSALGSGVFTPDDYNSAAVRAAEVPAAGGVGTARSVARMYASLIGEVDGVRILAPETVERARQPESDGNDAVLLMPTRFGLGFMVQGGGFVLYDDSSFGHYGAGGSVGFAVPSAGLAFGYVMNKMADSLIGDPRTLSLFEAVRASL